MFKFISKKLKKNNKGFTLVELIAVLAILGIIGAIAVPRFTATRKNAAIKAHEANVRILENAAKMYYTETGNTTIWEGKPAPDGKEDDPEYAWIGYLDEWPKIPDGLTKGDLDDIVGGEDLKDDDKVTNDDYTYKVEIKSNGEVKVTIEKQND